MPAATPSSLRSQQHAPWVAGGIALVAIVLTSSPVSAQDQDREQGRRRAFRGVMGRPDSMLAAVPEVQEELKLSDEQKAKVEALAGRDIAELQGLRDELADVPAEELQARVLQRNAEIREKSRANLAEVLEPEQRKRLDQIDLQVRGYQAFTTSDRVREALEFTDEQQARLREVGDNTEAKVREISQNAGGDIWAAIADMRKAREDAMNQVKEMLTEDQSARWKEMTGEPFGERKGTF